MSSVCWCAARSVPSFSFRRCFAPASSLRSCLCFCFCSSFLPPHPCSRGSKTCSHSFVTPSVVFASTSSHGLLFFNMHFFSSALLISAAATTALAHSGHAAHQGHAHLHHRQAAGSVLTTGANGYGDGQTHSRLEIGDIVANRPDQFVLLILAMSDFQARPGNSATSYWQIAGIHGVPRANWDSVSACASCGNADGYSTHDSILFPTWHRAYLALFEQEFLKSVSNVANRYPAGSRRDAMVAAAATMRLPYWDWAARADSGSSVLPSVLSSSSITVNGPNGQQTIANPFYQYNIPQASGMVYSPFTSWSRTLRYPTSNAASANSNAQSAVNAFANIQGSMQESVYNLLTVCNDYENFSNDNAGSSSASCSNSLEGIHNTIHTTAGGPGAGGVSGGHMTYLPLASFDPLFWIHHCNVDRLFALWQTIHPNSYGGSQVAPHNTWTIQSGSTQNADSPLMPFRRASGSYWTTNQVSNWATTFRYTYPEFLAGDGSRNSVVNFVNSLYGSSPSLTASSLSRRVEQQSIGNTTTPSPSSSAPVVQQPTSIASTVPTPIASAVPTSTTVPQPPATVITNPLSQTLAAIRQRLQRLGQSASQFTRPISNAFNNAFGRFGKRSLEASVDMNVGSDTASVSLDMGADTTALPSVGASIDSTTTSTTSEPQYVCNINTPRYTLNGSYSIYVFTGEPSTQDTTQWLGDANCAGTIGVMAGGDMAPELLISGSVPMTRHLQVKVQAGELQSMNEVDVTPYLATNLNWRIVKDGEEYHPEKVSGFKAALYSGSSSPATGDVLPEWAPMTPQIEVTKDKAGGCKSVEEAHDAWSQDQYPPQYSSPPVASTTSCTTTSTAAPVESTSAPVYPTSAPYPTGSSPAPYAPTGTAAPSAYGTSWVPSPSSSPIVPYTGAGAKASGNSLMGFAICAFAAMILL